MPTPTVDHWGPSLLLLASASTLGLGACRLPGASLEPSQAQPAQTPTPRKQRAPQPVAPTPKVRGFGVVDAELSGDGQTLRLSFTRPLAANKDVDPNDFRLSLGLAYTYERYAYAYYYDLGDYADEPDTLSSFVNMEVYGDTLTLTLSPAFPLSYCFALQAEIRSMQAEPDTDARGGMFLHYAPGQIPLRDTKGHKLAPAAAQWVITRREASDHEQATELYFEGPKARRAFNGAIPVRCGPPIPPGPR